MTILDRVRDRRGVYTDLGDIADDIRKRSGESNGFHPADLASGIAEGASDAATSVADAAKGATDAAKEAVTVVSDTTRERIESLGEIVRDVAREVSKAGGDMRLDERVDEIAQRLRAAMPASQFRGTVSRLERELPDTDKDRYDRAFERGRVRTRSVYIAGGVAVGIVAGIAGAVLLDVRRNPEHRARIAKLRDDATRQLSTRGRELADRAKTMAAERGIGQTKPSPDPTGVTDREMVPVMPVGEGVVTDPSSIIREPLPGEGGEIERGAPGSDAASTVDATGDRAVTANHG
jgi:hypothetical protein